jgi:hypothetical protein
VSPAGGAGTMTGTKGRGRCAEALKLNAQSDAIKTRETSEVSSMMSDLSVRGYRYKRGKCCCGVKSFA